MGRQTDEDASPIAEGTEILLVRHGKTVWNGEDRIQGSCDSPLTPAGEAAARALGVRLSRCASQTTGSGAQPPMPIVACYSSPLGRAWQTALRIAAPLGLEVRPAPELRERAYGVLEGLTKAERLARLPEICRRNDTRDATYAVPGGGDSREAVRTRARTALHALAVAHPGQRILVVTHSGLLSALIVDLLEVAPNSNPKVRFFAVPNAALNLLRWHGDAWQLVVWGDVGEFDTPPPLARQRRQRQRRPPHLPRR